MGRTRTVSVAQILDDARGLYLHEAIALCRQLGAHPVAGSAGPFPAADRIAITEVGAVTVLSGDRTAKATTAVMWLGGILHAVVACADDGREALPAGLKFTVARASGWTFDDPSRPADLGAFSPHASVPELLEAIRRYAPIDERAVLRTLFQRCAFRISFAPAPEPGMPVPEIPLAAVEAAPDPETADTSEDGPRSISKPSLALRLDGAQPRIELRSIEDLRRVRESAGVTIDAIRAVTNIPSKLIQDLERGDFKRWPRGVFARAYLTSYAQQIGVLPGPQPPSPASS
ncbi:MAG: helix-turn-helix domain-containing protein [Acidobacteria bacterium]|nr:helix-turn-helix domain-containing protein [Acidobacteriota bacterium]